MERRGSRSVGYGIVLLGAVAFVVGCFLPYWEVTGLKVSLSFFRIVVIPPYDRGDLAAGVGGFLYLFGGVATLGWVAIAGLRGSRWTRPTLAAVTVAWSLTWIGSLLGPQLTVDVPKLVGWWVLLLGVVVVVIGTIVIWVSDRRAESLPVQHVEEVSEG
jgi:hypothetical protein